MDERTGEKADARRSGLTRRRVLAGLGGVAGVGLAGAGGFILYDRQQRFLREPERTVPDHRVELPVGAPRMVVARGEDPARNVRAAVERLGGMTRFVGPGDFVVVKPNVGWVRTPEQGANTHPAVVGEVVRLCREARAARVVVADCPVRKDSRAAFERSGILRAASEAGAEVLTPESSRYVAVPVSERLGTWDVLEPFVLATRVVNVPVLKSHPLTGVTCGLKNWFGVTGVRRVALHQDVQRSIAEFAALMRPTLTVVDATRVLMGGPEGGNPGDVKPTRTVAAGTDPVALDAWANALFGARELPGNLAIAAGLGLGRLDYEALSPIEILGG